MKIFVISLKKCVALREAASRVLNSQSIDFEFIDAIDGRVKPYPFQELFNEEKFIAHRGRTVEPGELGCYASHMLAWEKVSEVNAPCVVLEDDFILSDEFVSGINICERWIQKHSFIRLEPWKTKLFYNVDCYEKYHLKRFLKIPQCTTGYMISPSCAKAFLNASKEIFLPVDVFIRCSYLHKQAIYGVTPSLLTAGSAIDSSIGGRKEKIKLSHLILN
jgi:glycosyl transferase family 25